MSHPEHLDNAEYKRITVRQGDDYFSVYCTDHSLTFRKDEVMQWTNRLAGRLHWTEFRIAVTTTSKESATQRPNALFETHHAD